MDLNIQKTGETLKDTLQFKGAVYFDESLAAHTTMKVGGKAALFVFPEDTLSLVYALTECKKNNVKYYILGAGSNVIGADEGFNGAVICTKSLKDIFVLKDEKNENSAYVCCGSGILIDDILAFCAKKGLKTLNSFAGLPATVGGAVYMNARCYNVDVKDYIESVEYLDLDLIEENFKKNAEIKKNLESSIKIYQNINKEEDWAYKLSPFTNKNFLITKVCIKAEILDSENFSKEKDASEEIQKCLEKENNGYVQDRTDKGHFLKPSAGSVFKNNRSFNVPSGKLVDMCGLKGTVKGGAEISSWHGNFIVNNGNACAADIKYLVHLAQEKVKEKFGFEMECEIIFM